MATEVEKLLNRKVVVVSSDGRTYSGILKSFDQTMNLVIENSKEMLYDQKHQYQELTMSTFLIRGENVVLIGESIEDKTDLSLIPGSNLLPVLY